MSLEVGVAWALALVFGALSAIHVYWAMGGKRGLSSVLPATTTTTTIGSRPLFQPGFVATATVALALALASLIVLWRAALIRPPGPPWIPVVGVWVLAVLFLGRALGERRYVGFFKRERGTRFARLDTWLYSPLCLSISISCLVLARSALASAGG